MEIFTALKVFQSILKRAVFKTIMKYGLSNNTSSVLVPGAIKEVLLLWVLLD